MVKQSVGLFSKQTRSNSMSYIIIIEFRIEIDRKCARKQIKSGHFIHYFLCPSAYFLSLRLRLEFFCFCSSFAKQPRSKWNKINQKLYRLSILLFYRIAAMP